LNESKVVTIEDRIPKLKQKRKQKANRRLIFTLSCFFFMILTVVYFQSPLSKVSDIHINGNENVTTEELIELSKLSSGTSFWSVNKDQIITNINKHNEIKETTVTRKLPNSVVIEVKELKRVAYVVDTDGKYYPILENGQTLDPTKLPSPTDAPILINWKNDSDIVGLASELKKLPESIANSISEIHHEPEESDPSNIRLLMNNGYEVIATIRDFATKMLDYPTVLSELDPSLKGVIYLDVVPYFDQYDTSKGDDVSESEG
jgi:cell division protein FtsQ